MTATATKNYNIGARLQDPLGVLKDDGALLNELQEKISSCMTRLFRLPENGGNPFIFAYTSSKAHELMAEMNGRPFTTAATDGRKYYWSPEFLKKLNTDEVSIVMEHEGYHTIFFHPDRMKMHDDKHVYNWAVDYVVNSVIEYEKEVNHSKIQLWNGNMGKPLPFKELLDWLDGKCEFDESSRIFADKSLYGRSPESIYDEIMKHKNASPRKCPVCGALSLDPKTKKHKHSQKGQGQKQKGQGQGQKGQGGQQPGQGAGAGGQPGQGGQQPGQGQGGCGNCPNCGAECDGSGDGSGLGSLDAHIDAAIDKQEVMGDLMRAQQQASQIGRGHVPAAIEGLLGELKNPTLKFTDIIRSSCMRKVQDAGMHNNWKKLRRRYLPRPGFNSGGYKGQFLPTRHTHRPRWLAFIDCSGSMSDEDLQYGISQLQCLGDTDGMICPVDAQVYWKDLVAIHGASKENLRKTKISGRGGTVFTEIFTDYAKHVGTEWDCIIIITDGDCGDYPIELRPRGSDCVWVLTRKNENFKPTFGRVVPMRVDRM